MSITPKLFQRRLLKWFDANGRKHLPWQQDKTAYRVWLSEIMLQQTQVSTVVPYFQRFLQTFPDIFALANASLDSVLHLWAGLGYYSRARNLHKAANFVVAKYQGQFPQTLSELQDLAGVGQSTAAAILSIAFDKPAAILDGNVKRVLHRLHAIHTLPNEKSTLDVLWKLAERYLPSSRAADYTQAMMDLGATLCTRSKPRCEQCPLQSHCAAYQQDLVAILPRKKISKKLPIRASTFLILKHQQQVLLVKRPATGIWGGLWSVPEMAAPAEQVAIFDYCRKILRFTVANFTSLPSFRHTFTHYHLDIFPILLEVKKVPSKIMEESKQIWYNLNQPDAIGLPKPVQSLMRMLK